MKDNHQQLIHPAPSTGTNFHSTSIQLDGICHNIINTNERSYNECMYSLCQYMVVIHSSVSPRCVYNHIFHICSIWFRNIFTSQNINCKRSTATKPDNFSFIKTYSSLFSWHRLFPLSSVHFLQNICCDCNYCCHCCYIFCINQWSMLSINRVTPIESSIYKRYRIVSSMVIDITSDMRYPRGKFIAWTFNDLRHFHYALAMFSLSTCCPIY